jgi:hypothetical protein
MKKLPILILIFAALGTGVFQACKKDPPPPPPPPPAAPKIAFVSGGSNAYAPGDSLKIRFAVTTTQTLANLQVKRTEGTSVVTTQIPLSGKSYTYILDTIIPPGTPFGTDISYEFTARDGDNKTTPVTTVYSVVDKGSPMVEITGQVGHIDLPGFGIYDLVGETNWDVSHTDSLVKDMINTSKTGSSIEPFVRGFKSHPSIATRFIKNNSFEYDKRGYPGYVKYAYDKSLLAPKPQMDNVAVNDIYLVKMRNGNYAVIKVTSVSDNSATNKEDGIIIFKYLK